MIFDAVAFSSIGGKKVNEDSVRLVKNENSVAAVLADGLGSHGGGDIASSITADAFAEGFLSCKDDAQINQLFKQTNEAVIAHQTPNTEMKSTLVTFKIIGNMSIFTHAGDSRGYIFRNNSVFFQTFDHSLPQMEVLRGNIKPAMIRFHPNRNKVLRALGVDGIYPEISKPVAVFPNDAFLICSDGFWEFITETEMAVDLSKANNTQAWISLMLERIGGRIERDTDNLSAVAVICK
jgi:serine/threonine protein phosphatase PrpC